MRRDTGVKAREGGSLPQNHRNGLFRPNRLGLKASLGSIGAGEDYVPIFRAIRRCSVPAGALVALLACTQAQAQGQAQSKSKAGARLDARYVVTLAGLKLGEGSWVVDIVDDQFVASANGSTSGMARIFSSGTGITTAKGAIKNGQIVPASYAVAMKWGKKFEDLEMKLANGGVKEVSINPPPIPHPDRVPVTDAHRKNAMDPMSGSLLRVPGDGDLMVPDTCKQHTPIFDGRMRYDLTFTYKRTEQVKVAGYQGPALVCSIYFAPLAGHVPDRQAIKYLMDQRDMETWLVPIGGTRVMIPVRVVIPTPLGQGILQATQLYSLPLPAGASAKTQ